MRSYVCVLFLCVGFVATPAQAAAEWFPPRMDVAGHDLIRSGKGTRSVLFFSVYDCALYLREPTPDAVRIIDAEAPIAIRIEVLSNSVETMPDGWRVRLREEVTERVFAQVRALYRELEEGDRVEIAFSPERGSWIELNGERIVESPDRGLVRAILDQWIGSNPVSPALKKALVPK